MKCSQLEWAPQWPQPIGIEYANEQSIAYGSSCVFVSGVGSPHCLITHPEGWVKESSQVQHIRLRPLQQKCLTFLKFLNIFIQVSQGCLRHAFSEYFRTQ